MLGVGWRIGRRKARSRLVRDELNESLEHFMRAASHAAGGVGATVGPRMITARHYVSPAAGRFRDAASHRWGSTVAALAPIASAAVIGARQARAVAREARATNLMTMRRQRVRRRWPMATGLLAAGTAAGAVGALVMRRRRQRRWDEYDPSRVLESMRSDTTSMIDTTENTVENAMDSTAARAQAKAGKISMGAEKAGSNVSATAERMADRAAAATGTVKEKTSSAAEGAKRQTDKAMEKGEDLTRKGGPNARNNRG